MCARDAPGHVNTAHNANPLSRRLPTMRSLLRYRRIVAAAFCVADAFFFLPITPLASHCFTLAARTRASGPKGLGDQQRPDRIFSLSFSFSLSFVFFSSLLRLTDVRVFHGTHRWSICNRFRRRRSTDHPFILTLDTTDFFKA